MEGNYLQTVRRVPFSMYVVDEKVSENILHKKTGKLSTPLLGPPDRTWA